MDYYQFNISSIENIPLGLDTSVSETFAKNRGINNKCTTLSLKKLKENVLLLPIHVLNILRKYKSILAGGYILNSLKEISIKNIDIDIFIINESDIKKILEELSNFLIVKAVSDHKVYNVFIGTFKIQIIYSMQFNVLDIINSFDLCTSQIGITYTSHNTNEILNDAMILFTQRAQIGLTYSCNVVQNPLNINSRVTSRLLKYYEEKFIVPVNNEGNTLPLCSPLNNNVNEEYSSMGSSFNNEYTTVKIINSFNTLFNRENIDFLLYDIISNPKNLIIPLNVTNKNIELTEFVKFICGCSDKIFNNFKLVSRIEYKNFIDTNISNFEIIIEYVSNTIVKMSIKELSSWIYKGKTIRDLYTDNITNKKKMMTFQNKNDITKLDKFWKRNKNIVFVQEDIASCGSKIFHLSTIDNLYNDIMLKYKWNAACYYYESWTKTMPIKFAMDIDFIGLPNIAEQHVKSLINYVKKENNKVQYNNIVVLKSDGNFKQSFHIIFNDIIFSNINYCKKFFAQLETLYNIRKMGADPAIYKPTCFRTFRSCKYGKNNMLQPYQITFDNGLVTLIGDDLEFFKKSLITYIEDKTKIIEIDNQSIMTKYKPTTLIIIISIGTILKTESLTNYDKWLLWSELQNEVGKNIWDSIIIE